MKQSLLIILLLFALCVTHASAQTRPVTGTVLAKDDGNPIPGASVKLKGTTTGVVTGVNGSFSINAPASGNSVLVFTFIGYTSQEVAIGNKSVINVTLAPDTKQLSEVVVTALGISRKEKALGYSVSQVRPADLVQQSEPDLLKTLQGKVAGVNIQASQGTPGAATRITMRGNSSFYGDNQPLIIVDGVPYSNDQITTTNQENGGGAYGSGIANLDPNDIASMTVLKGASSAALYGSRASNGVIIITTKSGSASRSKKGMEVRFNSSASIEKIANLPEYQNDYGAGSQFNYSNSNGSWGPAFSSLATIPVWPTYKAAYPELFPGATVPYVAQPNNVNNLFKTGVVYENSVGINTGDEKNALAITASQLNQSGYVPNSGYGRSSVAIGGNSKLEMGMHIGGNLSYSRSTQTGGIFGENQNGSVTVPSSFARSLFLARNWDTTLPYQDKLGNSLTPNGGGQFDNPLWSDEYNTVNTAEERIIADMHADYDLTKWANLSFALGSNVHTLGRKEVINIGSRGASGTGSIVEDNFRQQEIESTTLLTLNPQISTDFSLKAILGFNYNQRTNNRNVETGNIFITPGIYNLTNTQQQVFSGDAYSRRRLMGVFADVTLGYKDLAYINVQGRNDYSSTLPENSRTYFYPSVSGSFVFSEALKIQNDIFDFGKIRASYAKVGHDADPYLTQNVFAIGTNFLGQSTGHISTQSNDPALKPEFVNEIELGTQLSFFQKRIGLDVAVYNKTSTNLLAYVPTAPSTGYNTLYTNFGEINNKGIEVELTLKPLSSKAFNWTITTTYAKNRNVVNQLTAGVPRILLGSVLNTISTYGEPGLPYGYLRGTKNYRDGNGNLIINPATGTLIEDNQQGIIGDPAPKYKMGITNDISYKGFSLAVLFDMTVGGSLYSESINTELGRGVTQDTKNRLTTWIIPGVYGDPTTGKPILDGSGAEIRNTTRVTTNDLYFASGAGTETFAINAASEWSVYDATVYRLREISLGYQIPKSVFKTLPFIGSARISVSGRNLWFFAPGMPKYSNFDPEVNSFGATNVQGIEQSAAPTVKRYGINLSVTF